MGERRTVEIRAERGGELAAGDLVVPGGSRESWRQNLKNVNPRVLGSVADSGAEVVVVADDVRDPLLAKWADVAAQPVPDRTQALLDTWADVASGQA